MQEEVTVVEGYDKVRSRHYRVSDVRCTELILPSVSQTAANTPFVPSHKRARIHEHEPVPRLTVARTSASFLNRHRCC